MRTTTLHTHQGRGWSPRSRAGAWALTLAGLSFGGTATLSVAFALGLERAETFTDKDHWWITAAGAAILASAAGAAVAGVIAVWRRHDRAWGVLLAMAVGVALTVLMLQQVGEGLGWLES